MLENDQERAICKKYGAYDENHRVHCNECPLAIPVTESDWGDYLCKATCHKNKNGEWERDELE